MDATSSKFPVLKVYYLAAEVIVRKNKIFSTNYFLHAVIVIVLTEWAPSNDVGRGQLDSVLNNVTKRLAAMCYHKT